jgi:hypothetical protein
VRVKSKTIVLRLVGGDIEGQWREVPVDNGGAHFFRPLCEQETVVQLVATGSVEWNGDEPAEVYVPEDKLELWKSEHALDA